MVNMISDARGLAQTAQTLANTKNTTYIESTDPHDNPEITLKKGDTWIDTGHQNIMKKWNGTTWIELSDSASAQALELATTAYAASSEINKITYSVNTPLEGKTGDIWVCTNTSNNYHNMYICQETYQSNTSTQPNYIAPSNRLTKWTLTSSGKLYGTALNVNPQTGNINITAASDMTMGSNGSLTIQSGQVSIGGNSSVNIAANGSINMNTATGAINLTSGNVNLNGATIGMTGGKINATAGTINVAGATLNVAADDIDIGSSDIGEEDLSRNLILNSAANAMRYTYTPVTTQGSESITKTIDWTSSGWGTNSALSVGKAQDMINSITTEPSDYKNPFKNKKNVFKLTPTNSGNHSAWNLMSLNERIVEPGKYTAQIRFFATQSLINSLGTSIIDNYICFFLQHGNNMYCFSMCGFKSLNNNNNADYKVVKPGWNKWKRTFTITDDMLTQTNIRLYFWLKSGITLPILFTNVKLERGATATAWTAAPEDEEENYQLGQDLTITNWTKIIQNSNSIGFQAQRIHSITNSDDPNARADRIENGKMTLTPTEFNVEFDDKSAMKLTSTEANFSVENVKVKGHLSADVVNTQKAWSFVVNDTNYPSNTTSALQSMINNLGKYLTGNITITINKKIYGNLTFSGFKSSGSVGIILIFGDQSSSVKGCLHGTLYVRYCDSFEIRGKAYGSTTTLPPQNSMADRSGICIAPIAKQRYCIWASGVKYFLSRGASYTIEKSKYAALTGVVRVDEGTHAYFYRNCFMGKYTTSGSGNALQSYGLHAVTAMASMDDCIGGTSTKTGNGRLTYAVVASNGSTVRIHGTHKPYGDYSQSSGFISGDTAGTATAWDVNDTYSSSYDPDANYIDKKYSDTEVTPASPYCFTLASTSSSIANTTASTMRTKKTDRIMCGKDTVNGETLYYFGVWIFSSRIATALAGITSNNLVDAHLELDVHPLAGVSGTRTISVYYIPTQITAPPSGNGLPSTYFNSSRKIKDISLTIGNDNEMWQVPTCSVPISDLTNGNIKGFCIASTSNYTRFVNTGCKLVLTAKATDS